MAESKYTSPDTFHVDPSGAASAVDIMSSSYTGMHVFGFFLLGMAIVYFFMKSYAVDAVEIERRKCMCEMKRAEGKCIKVIVEDVRNGG